MSSNRRQWGQLTADTALNAVELTHHLKSTISLPEAVQMGAKLGCTPQQARHVYDSTATGETKIPLRRVCISWRLRLDILAMLWERRRANLYQSWRYLQVDASPQGWNYWNTRDDEIFFPLGMDSLSMLQALRAQNHGYRQRTLTLMTMGYGRTGLADKVETFGRQVLNDSFNPNPSGPGFDKYRNEVFGMGTDQSTEQAINESPNLLGCLELIKEDINKILREDCEMGSPEVANSRLLPNSLSTTDALHVIFKAMEYALKKSEPWRDCEKAPRKYRKLPKGPNVALAFQGAVL